MLCFRPREDRESAAEAAFERRRGLEAAARASRAREQRPPTPPTPPERQRKDERTRALRPFRPAALETRVEAAQPSTAPTCPVSPKRDANGRCDKCDGDHDSDRCPAYPREREVHADATRRRPPALGSESGPPFRLRHARVVPQPGDGSCLFHALSYGLHTLDPHASGGSATALRRALASWVAEHGEERIADTPLRDWVRWDSSGDGRSESEREYARRMARSGWGGGIEMAACSRLLGVNVHVYERDGGAFLRISRFDAPRPTTRTLHILFQGGNHYDALEPAARPWESRL
jgi:hypothetical protein